MISTHMDQTAFVSVSSSNIQRILPKIIQLNIPLRRKRNDGTFSYIPPKEYDQYLKDKKMTFYLDSKSIKKLKQGIVKLKNMAKSSGGHSSETTSGQRGTQKKEGAVENVLILDDAFRYELDMMPECCPFRSDPTRLQFAVIWMRTKTDDPQFAIVFRGL